MSKREIPEINAGSMADIAFLLLIFFLVTTTMEKETGITKTLPQKVEIESDKPIVIEDRNRLDIKVNKKDQLLIESNLGEVNELYGMARKFLMNEENSDKYPRFNVYRLEQAQLQVRTWEQTLKDAEKDTPEYKAAEKQLEDWQERLTTMQATGEPTMREIHKMAIITVEMDDKSSYGRYIEIYSELQAAQNDLRDELSVKYFGVNFDELDDVDDADKILAIQKLVPQRIVKKEN